jgi:hypothetical protein
VSAGGGDWSLIVRGRFGLFGQDSVSWITDRTIYTGDFGKSHSSDEILWGDDVCQNFDGSSVMLNYRVLLPSQPNTVEDLTRIVELNITTSDAVPGNPSDVSFAVGYSDALARDDVSQTITTSYDTTSPLVHACNQVQCTVARYDQDPTLPAYCGDSSFRPGTYTTDGEVGTSSIFTSVAGEIGSTETRITYYRYYWGHDGTLRRISTRTTTETRSVITDNCDASFNAAFSRVTAVSPNGDTNGSGNPCSAAGTVTWTVTIGGGYNYTRNQTNTVDAEGGLYINDDLLIGWSSHYQSNRSEWYSQDSSFDDSGSYTEGDPPNYPPEMSTVSGWCQSWIVGNNYTIPYGDETNGNTFDDSGSRSVDGVPTADYGPIPIGMHYLRQYCNNICSLVLIGALPEGDPGNPDWAGQWGLVAEGSKALTGKILDATFSASVDPVTGAVTIHDTDQLCYA